MNLTNKSLVCFWKHARFWTFRTILHFAYFSVFPQNDFICSQFIFALSIVCSSARYKYVVMYLRIFVQLVCNFLFRSITLFHMPLIPIGAEYMCINLDAGIFDYFLLNNICNILSKVHGATKMQIFDVSVSLEEEKTVFVGYIESMWCSQHDTFGLLSSIRLSSIEPIVFEDIDMLHLINWTTLTVCVWTRTCTYIVHTLDASAQYEFGWMELNGFLFYVILFELKLSYQCVRVTFLLALLPFLLLF